MLSEYDFSKGFCGKYAMQHAEGSNVVLLSPDVAKIFRTSESVNEALRMLVRVGRKSSRKLTAWRPTLSKPFSKRWPKCSIKRRCWKNGLPEGALDEGDTITCSRFGLFEEDVVGRRRFGC
jgi:hypothetical protein